MEKRSIRDAEQRTQTICLLILTAIGIGVALLYLRQVLVPFVLAVFLAMAVTPILDYLRRRFRMPRGMAIGVTIALASVVLVFLGGLVSAALQEVIVKRQVYVNQVGGLIEVVDEVVQDVTQKMEDMSPFAPSKDKAPDAAEVPGSVPGLSGAGESPDTGASLPPSETIAAGAESTSGGLDPTTANLGGAQVDPRGSGEQPVAKSDTEPQSTFLLDMAAKVPDMFKRAISWVLNSAAALMSQGLLVLIFMMFLITGYRSPEEGGADGADTDGGESLSHEIRQRVKEYLRVKVLVSTLTGVSTYVILRIFGVDLALVFGLAAFFLNFIPNIGSLVAVLLPVPVILLAPAEDLGTLDKLLAVSLPAGIQFLVGNVLEPRWMGKSLDLNPIVILLALIFWGVLWGPVGMLLSVPITAVLKMLLERSELTQPVAVLLSEDG